MYYKVAPPSERMFPRQENAWVGFFERNQLKLSLGVGTWSRGQIFGRNSNAPPKKKKLGGDVEIFWSMWLNPHTMPYRRPPPRTTLAPKKFRVGWIWRVWPRHGRGFGFIHGLGWVRLGWVGNFHGWNGLDWVQLPEFIYFVIIIIKRCKSVTAIYP